MCGISEKLAIMYLFCSKMYWRIFSNTSGNVLNIVTTKIGAKFP